MKVSVKTLCLMNLDPPIIHILALFFPFYSAPKEIFCSTDSAVMRYHLQ